METLYACENCGKKIEEPYEHLGRNYCEDCYMDILSPPKACDPWAVYAAKRSLQSNDKFSTLTPLQHRIVDYAKAKAEVTAKDLTERLGLTEEEFKREFAVLRHMEVLRGTKKGQRSCIPYSIHDPESGEGVGLAQPIARLWSHAGRATPLSPVGAKLEEEGNAGDGINGPTSHFPPR